MSFSSEQKSEIIKQPTKNTCCRRALLDGIVFSRGSISDGRVTVSVDGTELSEFVSKTVLDVCGKEASPVHYPDGGRRRAVSFTAPSVTKYLTAVRSNSCEIFKNKCPMCSAAFLRGVFLAGGRVSDPQKQYRMELSLVDGTDMLKGYLDSVSLPFSVAVQRGARILYSGNSSVLEDFFASCGMNNTAYIIMNMKIEAALKNSVNRVINCETRNIGRSVSAAAKQIAAIEALDDANMLSSLPDELEHTARMRLKFRDYSLTRLAAEFSPPISKPGLSHRLARIVEIYELWLKK